MAWSVGRDVVRLGGLAYAVLVDRGPDAQSDDSAPGVGVSVAERGGVTDSPERTPAA